MSISDGLQTAGRQAKQGASFGFADEIQDVIGSAGAYAILKGMKALGRTDLEPDFKDLLEKARSKSSEELERDWIENPGTSIMGNIAGFLPFAVGNTAGKAAVEAPGLIGKAAEKIAKFNTELQTWASSGGRAARTLKGAAVGTGYGAASGLGAAGDTASERLTGTAMGGGIGAGAGTVLGAVSRALPSGAKVAKTAAKQASQNPAENEFLREMLMRPDLGNMIDRGNQLKAMADKFGIELTLPELIAQTDVDPLLAKQSVLTKSPETAGLAQSLIQRRRGDALAGQPGQIVSALQGISERLAPGSYDDLAQRLIASGKDAAGRITKNLKETAGPLYKEAMQANKSMASPELDRILETPAGQQALAQARTILQNEGTRLGVPDKELGELARELGIKTKGGVASGLKLQTYDLIKRGLDDAISNEMSRSTPGTTSAKARGLMSVRNRLLDELDQLDVTGITGPNSTRPDGGAYARARGVYSSQPEVLGNRKLMGELANIDNLSPERVVPQLYSGTPGTAQRTAQALGPDASKAAAAAKLQDIIGGLKSGALPPRFDADTINILKTYAGQSGQDINDVLQVIERARSGNRYLMGSQTQTNIATEKGMQEAAANAAMDLATGNKVGLARRGLSAIGEAVRGNTKEQYNRDLYELFNSKRGLEALQQAKTIQDALAGMPRASAGSMPEISGNVGLAAGRANNLQEAEMPAIGGASIGGMAEDYIPQGTIIKGAQGYIPQGTIVRPKK